MTYRNILAAVDRTDDADEVLRAARELAESDDSIVSVVTVVTPLAYYHTDFYSLVGDSTNAQIEAEAVKQATAWLSGLTKQHGIDGSVVNAVLGKPAVEIRRLAEELDADLIVIGTHGRHGLGLMLGSTANAVLHGAQCDVLAVKIRVDGSK